MYVIRCALYTIYSAIIKEELINKIVIVYSVGSFAMLLLLTFLLSIICYVIILLNLLFPPPYVLFLLYVTFWQSMC